MNVLVIGKGGREHALCKKIAVSPHINQLYCCPGNPGIGNLAQIVDIDPQYFAKLYEFITAQKIELVVVGPEDPLIKGITDYLQAKDIAVFGPTAQAAALEGSKAFAKELMQAHNIPTAAFAAFTDYEQAQAYLAAQSAPIVVKASGNALGKGAVVCQTLDQAQKALQEMMQQKIFGAAGEEVVIEECMQGAEASVFVVTDGHAYKFLAAAQDHKPIYADDQGPNTGGMGAYAPTPLVDPSLLQTVERSIVQPTLQAMQNKGCPYQGVLYVGLMLTNQGPKVVEFNCRFGDPEAQILFPLIDSDLLEMLQATAQGKLADYDLQLNSNYATCVVIASGGYPGKYQKGLPIEISGKDTPDSYILQAGTALQNGQLITAGGRVLNAIGIDPDLKTSIAQAYERAQQVNFEGMYYRPDIGAKGLKYLVK